MKRRRVVLLAVIFFGMVGCLTTGRDFPSEVDWIKKDDTTKKDVEMILGPPFAIGNSGGVPTWTYAYYKYQLWGNSYHKELKFYWQPDSSVKHFSFNSSFPGDLPGAKSDHIARPPLKDDRAGKETSSKTPYPSY